MSNNGSLCNKPTSDPAWKAFMIDYNTKYPILTSNLPTCMTNLSKCNTACASYDSKSGVMPKACIDCIFSGTVSDGKGNNVDCGSLNGEMTLNSCLMASVPQNSTPDQIMMGIAKCTCPGYNISSSSGTNKKRAIIMFIIILVICGGIFMFLKSKKSESRSHRYSKNRW